MALQSVLASRLGKWEEKLVRSLKLVFSAFLNQGSTKEFDEINVFEARVEMRLYLADFDAEFHDIRGPGFSKYYNPDSYADCKRFPNCF